MASMCNTCDNDMNTIHDAKKLARNAFEYESSGKALRDVLDSLFPDEVDEPTFIKRVKNNGKHLRDEIGMGETFMSIRTCNSKATNVVEKVVLPMIKRMYPKAKITNVCKTVHNFQKTSKTSKIQNYMMVIVMMPVTGVLENFHGNQSKQHVRDVDAFINSKRRAWQNIR